jgi:hypothetical protein
MSSVSRDLAVATAQGDNQAAYAGLWNVEDFHASEFLLARLRYGARRPDRASVARKGLHHCCVS